METSDKLVAIGIFAIFLVGIGVGIFVSIRPTPEGRPQFDVLVFQVIGNSVSMYVQNDGSSDAHQVRIEVYGYSGGDGFISMFLTHQDQVN